MDNRHTMLTTLQEPPEEVQRFRSTPWRFQQSFITPRKDLGRFVSTIMGPYSVTKAALTTDEVVFEPSDVINLLASHSITLENCYKFTLQAEGQACVTEMLQVVLSNWIDFLFVPTPQSFVIYADHDDYTTLYLQSHLALTECVERLREAGFKAVEGYTRGCSG
jgi:hypothetical protein